MQNEAHKLFLFVVVVIGLVIEGFEVHGISWCGVLIGITKYNLILHITKILLKVHCLPLDTSLKQRSA